MMQTQLLLEKFFCFWLVVIMLWPMAIAVDLLDYYQGLCPKTSMPEIHYHELQLAVLSDATVCTTKQKNELSQVIASLMDSAYAEQVDNNILLSESIICDTPEQGAVKEKRRQLLLEAEGTTNHDVMEEPSKTHDHPHGTQQNIRNLLWGRYIYRGGSKCLFCNPEDGDWRFRHRDLKSSGNGSPCSQEDKHMPTKDFLPRNWGGEHINRYFKIPKEFSMVTITFKVVMEAHRQMEWFDFFSHDVDFRIPMNNGIYWRARSFKNTNSISWAYKSTKYKKHSGHHEVQVVVHLPDKFFRHDGGVGVNFVGKRLQRNKKVKIKDLMVVARQFCDDSSSSGGDENEWIYKEPIENGLSKYISTEVEKRLNKQHCMKNRNVEVFVNLFEKKDWKSARPKCSHYTG